MSYSDHQYVAVPHDEERVNNPIDKAEFDVLLDRAKTLLNVHNDQYDDSIRHTVVKDTLQPLAKSRGVTSLPLGVERRTDNPEYVTWTGSNTILGNVPKDPRFTLVTEMRVTELIASTIDPKQVDAVLVRNLNTNDDELVIAKVC
jgi:pyranose oxidase